MKTISYIITDELGIHARPAGMIAKLAKGYKSEIKIGTSNKMADASRVIGIMSLCMKQGDEIIVTVDGEDEGEAAEAISALLKDNL